MKRTLVSRVYINAFYFPRTNSKDDMIGYVKMKVGNYTAPGSGKTKDHPDFPYIIVPSSKKSKEIKLDLEGALGMRKLRGSLEEERTQWDIFEINPKKDRRKREVILSKLESYIVVVSQNLRSLYHKREVQRLGFLKQFPEELREGVDYRQVYGTIDNSKLGFTINEGEMEIPVEKEEESSLTQKLVPRPAGQWER